MSAIKLLENFLFTSRRDTEAAIEDLHLRKRSIDISSFHQNSDFFGGVRILFRIGEQVDENLSQRIAIGADRHRALWKHAIEFKSIRFEVRTISFSRFSNQFIEITRAKIVFFLASFQPVKIEHV